MTLTEALKLKQHISQVTIRESMNRAANENEREAAEGIDEYVVYQLENAIRAQQTFDACTRLLEQYGESEP